MSSEPRALKQFNYPAVGGESVGPLRIEIPPLETETAEERQSAAREAGVREGQQRARQEFEQALTRERQAIATAINEFTTERRRYREKVEAEVVQLALSIARKVLQREAQMDPLLLAGAVRVGLDRLPKEAVVLRVPPAATNRWKAFFAQQHEMACPPEIVPDPALTGESCVLESRLGSMQLGLETQLTAIERGLSELLGPTEAVQP